MKDGKDCKQDIADMTYNAVRGLVTLNPKEYGEVVVEQCKTIGITIGTMMAPQLYGARIHGVGNAVSIVVRSCAEALFWLNYPEKKAQDVIADVEKLRDILTSPGLS